MKKLLMIFLLLLPFCFTACRKGGPGSKPDGADDNKNVFNPEGYVIQGKMINTIVNDGGREQPYIILFKANNQALLVNVSGERILSYSTDEGKIILNDNGYFNLQNGQITDWLIAGFNFKTATLYKNPETSQLKGKKFGGSKFFVKINASIYSEIQFDANTYKLSYPRNDDGKQYDYLTYGNLAGFRHDSQTNINDFFMIEKGKLEIAGYSDFNQLSAGTYDQQ